MLQLPGREKLATWQVELSPAEWIGEIAAKRIADHRAIYMTFEGDISDGRGSVKRVESGEAIILGRSPAWRLKLRGAKMDCEIIIREDA